jgi:dihydrofolate reductase
MKERAVRRLTVFNSVSIDGYFTDANNDMSFAHNAGHDDEWTSFTSENASGEGQLLFGRITYEMMASFWPTPQAAQQMPVVARQMNALPKVVFSRTLNEATWANTKLVKGDLVTEVRRMKGESGKDMVILGSGSIVSQLAQAGGLIDEYQLVTIPIALGKGRTLFDGVDHKVPLRLIKTRSFKNGNVVSYYEAKDV